MRELTDVLLRLRRHDDEVWPISLLRPKALHKAPIFWLAESPVMFPLITTLRARAATSKLCMDGCAPGPREEMVNTLG